MCRSFNIRVYGFLYNTQGEVLVTDEHRFGRMFTKFPGGGLEHGEGMHDCLIREFKEELDITIHSLEHVYTTDFYQPSAFDPMDQIISVYYQVKSDSIRNIEVVRNRFDFNNKTQVFRWLNPKELKKSDLDFPIDQHVLSLI